jgi:hypothetical protein
MMSVVSFNRQKLGVQASDGHSWAVGKMMEACKSAEDWCRGTESNCRHQPFQGCALPTELPRHKKQKQGGTVTGIIGENQGATGGWPYVFVAKATANIHLTHER